MSDPQKESVDAQNAAQQIPFFMHIWESIKKQPFKLRF
jgi:hypothetical protein